MWSELGLDLNAHDALLSVLSEAYQNIFLSQKMRPQGMKYFDFVMSEGVVFAGGVALNSCVKGLIAEELKRPVFVPDDPQTVGAYGAALYGQTKI